MKLLLATVLFFISFNANALTDFEKQLKAWQNSSGPLPKRLEKLYQLYWDWSMHNSPEWATFEGYPGLNDQLTDLSLAAIERRKNETRFLQKVVNSVPSKTLKGEDAVTYGLFKFQTDRWIESFQFPEEFLPIHQMGGVQQEVADVLLAQPRLKLKDYQDRILRLEKIPIQVEQILVLLQEGLKKKVMPPKVVLATVPSQFEALLTTDFNKNPLYESFQEIQLDLSAEEKVKLQKLAQDTIRTKAMPAFQKLLQFLKTEYIPQAREDVAWSALPDGKAWYQYKAQFHTTTKMTPEEIHQLGLREVERIRGEMDKVRQSVGFRKSLKEFDQFLKTDSQFIAKSSGELISGFREIAKRVDPELPRLFGRLPRLTYGVREMPLYKATSGPGAYYLNGSLENGRAGYFEANTYDLKSRHKWKMEALTLHEAVPGHHLQIALAQEITGYPKFRNSFWSTAFGEGWGLYAESLGEELGLYKDPYSKYGQLMMEMWRAIRLVVDTGVHAKGWSRDQVMQYFRDNGPFEEQEIISETDRYIANAGQALAYKIGELKFKELRQKAKQELGDRFDLRKFHDQALGSGSLPMGVLEAKMNSWIEAEKKTKNPTRVQ